MSDIRTPFTQQPARGAPMRQQYGQFAYAQPSVPVGYAQPFPQATGPQRAYATAYQQALRARAANGRITYGDILTDQAMALYTARVNGVSTIIMIMSVLSLFFGVIIFSSLGVLTGCLQLGTARAYGAPEHIVKRATIARNIAVACLIVDSLILAAIIAMVAS